MRLVSGPVRAVTVGRLLPFSHPKEIQRCVDIITTVEGIARTTFPKAFVLAVQKIQLSTVHT